VQDQAIQPDMDRKVNQRVALIMPVYNESETIEKTIKELQEKIINKTGNVDLWIFEDGSTDGTKKILEEIKKESPNIQIRMTPRKKGYPRAMKEAFLSINPKEYCYIIALDSDGQYEPNDFFKLWSIMQRDSPDIVMGRRMTRREPPYRRMLSRGLGLLEKIMFPVKYKDVTSVMRLMKVDLAQKIVKDIKYTPTNFWLEFTARSSLIDYTVVEIPINYRFRSGGSRIYNVKKMPMVILKEFYALYLVRKESQKN
jgi:glycosyltransferase involved in cell wall biosynthesis